MNVLQTVSDISIFKSLTDVNDFSGINGFRPTVGSVAEHHMNGPIKRQNIF